MSLSLPRVLMQNIAWVINLISIWILLHFIYENILVAMGSKKFVQEAGARVRNVTFL